MVKIFRGDVTVWHHFDSGSKNLLKEKREMPFLLFCIDTLKTVASTCENFWRDRGPGGGTRKGPTRYWGGAHDWIRSHQAPTDDNIGHIERSAQGRHSAECGNWWRGSTWLRDGIWLYVWSGSLGGGTYLRTCLTLDRGTMPCLELVLWQGRHLRQPGKWCD